MEGRRCGEGYSGAAQNLTFLVFGRYSSWAFLNQKFSSYVTFRVMNSKDHMYIRQNFKISAMIIKLIFGMEFIISLIFESSIKWMRKSKLFSNKFSDIFKIKKKNLIIRKHQLILTSIWSFQKLRFWNICHQALAWYLTAQMLKKGLLNESIILKFYFNIYPFFSYIQYRVSSHIINSKI